MWSLLPIQWDAEARGMLPIFSVSGVQQNEFIVTELVLVE